MENAAKVSPVVQCKAMGRMYSNASEFKHRMPTSRFSYGDPTMLRIADFALAALETAHQEDIATHEKNAPFIEANKIVTERVTALMAEVAMPDGWSERDPNSRARVPRTISHKAGWKTDLGKHCSTTDGFDYATQQYERLKADYTKYREEALKDEERRKGQAEREQAALLAKRRADMELAAILLRYNLPIESTWSDVLDALRIRDQRLDLAVAMEEVRGDWNDGCGAVEAAISRFTIRTDEDKEIANDVLGCTRDFEDGRVFRDTTWNYDALYASVADRALAADVQTARAHARNE
jgi:hypothetical protein